MDIAELLAEMGDSGPRRSDPLPEAQIATLKEAYERINAPNPFKPGDLVTVRADSNMRGCGKPHLVIGVNETGYPSGSREASEYGIADLHNIHFIWTDGVNVVSHTLPHWYLDPYQPA